MRKIIGAKIIGELRARIDSEAAYKKCSLTELIQFIRVRLASLKCVLDTFHQLCN